MAIQAGHQPEVRFHKVGPNSLAGVSYLPKSIFIEKSWTTATEDDDFLTLPAGAFVIQAYAVCTAGTGNTTTEISLGQDGSAHSIIAHTDFSSQTTGNYTYFNTGLYLPDGDTLRITVGGTPAAGEAQFVLTWYEFAAMDSHGAHFDR